MLGAAALSAWMMVSLTRGAAGRGRASDPESKKGDSAKAEPPEYESAAEAAELAEDLPDDAAIHHKTERERTKNPVTARLNRDK
ncbi:MAG: hypothetical protein ACI3VJ_03825 [Hominicoprocola sp.]